VDVGHVAEALHPDAGRSGARIAIHVGIAVYAGLQIVFLAKVGDFASGEADFLSVYKDLDVERIWQVRNGRTGHGVIEVLGV